MFGKARGRGRVAALAMAGAVVVLGTGACGAAGTTGTAASLPATTPQATPPQATAPQAAVQQTGASGAASGAISWETSAAREVPWQSVGPGWILDTYSTGTVAKPAPTTLYLVSPADAKYALLTWPASAMPRQFLEAWAGDKTEALFALYSPGGQPDGYGELNLMTATMTRVAFADPAIISPVGYTMPDGQQILAVAQRDPNSPATILANCGALWLVPSGGAKPTELTPVRKASSSDLGDIDAWQLPSGLYLQSLGACGTLELNKQASDGSVTAVTVPGMAPSPVVVAASGARLLIAAQGCHPGFKLAWYNPATGAEQWIFPAGSQATVAYNDPDNGALR